MADTSVQRMVEAWVRGEWMPRQYGQDFTREQVSLRPGGHFSFAAVSADGGIVAAISTSRSRTAGGKPAVGNMNKIRSDILFLLLTDAREKVVIFTEYDMYERWLKEVENGRVPSSIEFSHAEIPQELNMKLQASRRTASREVTPG